MTFGVIASVAEPVTDKLLTPRLLERAVGDFSFAQRLTPILVGFRTSAGVTVWNWPENC